MSQSGTMFLSVLLLMVAASYAQEDCPNEASECPNNCGGETVQCARFLRAECRENPCYGLCSPNFFWRGRNVTDRCNVQRCADKDCLGNRQCVEETVPTSCPEDRPLCRQYIQARCVLPTPPTDCSQVTCGPGMFCREKKRGEGVSCVRVKNCNQLTCSDGLSCTETEEGPKCVDIEVQPTTTPIISTVSTPFPNFCDFCERLGQVCDVVNGTYQCSDPTECIGSIVDYCLNILGQICEETDGRAQCVFAPSCNDIECPRGTICVDFNPFSMFAYCSPLTTADTCEELNCERIPNQACEQRNDSAVCVPACTEQDNEICELLQGKCEVIDGFPQCVLPSNCDELECDPGFACVVIEALTNDTQDIVTCIQELLPTCEETVCPDDHVCFEQSLPSRNFSIAQCVTKEIAGFLPTVDLFRCTTSPEPLCLPSQICTDIFENDQLLSYICNNFTLNCSNDTVTACFSDEICTDVPANFASVVGFSSICLPLDKTIFELSIGVGCDSSSKQCPIGLVCQDIYVQGLVTGSTCGVSNPNVIGGSCDELQCSESFECADSVVFGRSGLAQCINEETANSVIASLNF